jgi:hypothetical protein
MVKTLPAASVTSRVSPADTALGIIKTAIMPHAQRIKARNEAILRKKQPEKFSLVKLGITHLQSMNNE